MSVNSIGGIAPQTAPYSADAVKKPEDGSDKELTTVTTQCNKDHEHDKSCPHTVSTRPAPQAGEPGSNLDKSI